MTTRRTFMAVAAGAVTALSIPEAMATAKRLVLIHGRQQQGLDQVALRDRWVKSLSDALKKKNLTLASDLQIEFPYYGDELDRFVTLSKLPLVTDITSRGDGTTDDLLAFQSQFVDEMIKKAAVPDELVDEEFGNRTTERGPLNWEWVQAGLRALDRHTGLSGPILAEFTRDVYLYLKVDACRKAINGIVGASLNAEPTVVVAHSLGTVVAYDVLRAQNSATNVPLLITLGSPLGIMQIRNSFRPLEYPQGVQGWFNAYDERDYVALYALDESNFAITPAIENYGAVQNQPPSRHAIVDYLSNEKVAERIYGAL
ncbi:hypothetical protein [Allomesorhizobium alhagi]|uniref:V8-like Glu-specific endopeptidase n=1 Tax=Mesorhizobium alhagi CCNWXJ12-2 TaxID=1107882 RepID=H0HUN6_9HYPH|nr:hypothetical protein [Mesorhizobium alhagi]EHK55582.1 V8-like Glu-specific endopeptidase [Mesorhizobium alhagi CCNWXJ12-2]